MPAGRPSDYTPELADKICERLADAESMRKICLDDDMPNKRTVFRWIRSIPEFCHQYERAKQESADTIADQMLDIADDGQNDYMETLDNEGDVMGFRMNGEYVQRSRLRIDTRKWIASKLKPKKYGEKSYNEHTGKDGNPIEVKTLTAEGYKKAREEMIKADDV